MKWRRFGRIIIIAFLIVWLFKFYDLNGTLCAYDKYDILYFKMGETVQFENCMSYGVIYQPGYEVKINNARIIDGESYYSELRRNKSDFLYPFDRYLELDATISNYGDGTDGIMFYSLPVCGDDWYIFYSDEATAYANPIYNNQVDQATGIKVSKNNSMNIKIVYGLNRDYFTKKRWANLENEKMWVNVTKVPVEKRILIIL